MPIFCDTCRSTMQKWESDWTIYWEQPIPGEYVIYTCLKDNTMRIEKK